MDTGHRTFWRLVAFGCVVGCAAVVFAQEDAFAQSLDPAPLLAPINKAFVQQQSLPATLRFSTDALTLEPHASGYIPSPVDRSHMTGQSPDSAGNINLTTSGLLGAYPSTFDLRTSGKVTSVKNQ